MTTTCDNRHCRYPMNIIIICMIIAAMLLLLCLPLSASACTLFYAGGDLTDDGANMFIRVEETYDPIFNKIYYVSPVGRHTQGEQYQGCYGFTWTFTHDSYQYTARRDDNLSGICPDCNGVHDHTPYEEAGTNDHGVTVSATETLISREEVENIADPYLPNGIEESDMTTVLLSEAATAREGVRLLLDIFDQVGAYGGSGVMIADQNEQWYIESLSGHTYIAVLLPKDVAFLQANASVLGRINLSDHEHVIASDNIISVAQQAGTFVGDAAQNIIDYRASFNVNDLQSVILRTSDGQHFLTGTENGAISDNDFILTNVDENGAITPLHNDFMPNRKLGINDIFALYRLPSIARPNNMEAHLYRFYPEEELLLGTVEWSTMGNCRYNVYVPSYPMLLSDTWEGCKVPLSTPVVMETAPEGTKDYYVKNEQYTILPDGWENSYCATMKALSSHLIFGEENEDDIALVQKNMLALQDAFEQAFTDLSAAVHAEPSVESRKQLTTQAAVKMTEEVHDLALALYRHLVYGETSDLILPAN